MGPKHTTKSQENIFTKRREPFGFMLWLGVGGSCLLFLGIFSIYLFRSEHLLGNYALLPDVFWLSTLVILFSSITLHECNLAFIQERFFHYRLFLGTTFSLGLIFIMLQTSGWLELMESWAYTKSNTSTGLVYLLTGLHLLHILAGIIYLGVLFRKAVKNRSYIDSFVFSVNAPNRLKLKLVTRYWHFVDVLWLVIFLFLVILYH